MPSKPSDAHPYEGVSSHYESYCRICDKSPSHPVHTVAQPEYFDMSRLKPPSANQTHIGGPHSSLKQPQPTPEPKEMLDAATRRILFAASHALRSYQYGNASPELADQVANVIDAHIGNIPAK